MTQKRPPLERVLDPTGPAAPPRRNGELVFRAPWESRVFGATLVLYDRGAFTWDEFRERLIAAIARAEAVRAPAAPAPVAAPESAPFPYYECWLEALEDLLAAKGLCAADALATREQALAARPPGHDH